MEHIREVINKRMEHRGVTVGALARKTGIDYNKLFKSLSPKLNRQMFASEFMAICNALELTLADFVIDNTSKEQTA